MSKIAIVGASLAGQTAAETLRSRGFDGELTLIGGEACEPYDRPPLSKQVLTGWVPADRTRLPRTVDLGDVDWRLGVPASHLDVAGKKVALADGSDVEFDQLLIATGVRNRPWPDANDAALDGVVSIRSREDARELSRLLDLGPDRVLVIGAGFTGSEVASVCRQRDIAVTCVERGPTPLAGALGATVGETAAGMHRDHGVDLRCGVSVDGLDGNDVGRVRRARLSDGTALDVDVVVVALGAVRNTEWLLESGLAAGPLGVACDAGCRVIDVQGLVTEDIFVAGDVARFPHPVYEYQLLALEHWENAVVMAEIAAHNMVCAATERRAHVSIPAFWSIQFGVNIKSVGAPAFADQVLVTQGDPAERRFAAAYGRNGRVVAAVTFNHAKYLEFYRELIESAAPFPDALAECDAVGDAQPAPARFPHPSASFSGPTVALTGYAPTDMRVRRIRPQGA